MRENPKLISDFRRWDRAGRPSSAEIQARRLGKLADRARSMEIRGAEALAHAVSGGGRRTWGHKAGVARHAA